MSGITVEVFRSEDVESLAAGFASMNKSSKLFERYLREQSQERRLCFTAWQGDRAVGYATILWESACPGVPRGVPEIEDVNVVPSERRRGIATALLDEVEARAFSRSERVAIGVGLHPGYNAAQRLYVLRGYVPDGLGVSYRDRFVQEGETVPFDDNLVLHLIKDLGGAMRLHVEARQ